MIRCCFTDYDPSEYAFLNAFHPFGKGFRDLQKRRREGDNAIAVMESKYIPDLKITFRVLPVNA